MKILITGVAGFIGTNLALHLLSKKYKIFGIDNLDDYNSIKLKKFRLKTLSKNRNFFFKKIDITKREILINFVKNKKFDLIIHLAGQAGVRYSIINPIKYINSNIFGFLNIIFAAKKYNIKRVFYASSSSVYGDNNFFPLKEKYKLKQKNIYAVSKMLNEKMAETYSKISNIKFIGMRFFTIYGEFGRTDMFLFKLFKAYKTKKTFELNNYGNHKRDFTYIKDVNTIIEKLIKKKNLKKNLIINICSNNPINILKIANLFKKRYKLKIKNIKKNKADVLKTHGDNTKLKNIIKFKKFSNFENNLFKIYNWYNKYKIYQM